MSVVTAYNGWPVITAIRALAPVSVAGVADTGEVLAGDVHTIMQRLVERWHVEVEPLVTINGWRSRAANAAAGGAAGSPHLAGTALDLNGARHPRYVHGTFSRAQVAAIRALVGDLGVLTWGGEWASDVDEMHVEITRGTTAAQVAAAAHRLTTTPATSAATTHAASAATTEEDVMLLMISPSRGYRLIRSNGTYHTFAQNPAYPHQFDEWAARWRGVFPERVYDDSDAGKRAFDIDFATFTQPTL